MPDIAVTVADYLKNPALFTAAPTPSAVAWGLRGIESEVISPLWNKADADTQATREAAFLNGPLVEDVATVKGKRRDLMHKVVTIKGDKLGYGAGVAAFVIGYQENGAYTDLVIVRSIA